MSKKYILRFEIKKHLDENVPCWDCPCCGAELADCQAQETLLMAPRCFETCPLEIIEEDKEECDGQKTT